MLELYMFTLGLITYKKFSYIFFYVYLLFPN